MSKRREAQKINASSTSSSGAPLFHRRIFMAAALVGVVASSPSSSAEVPRERVEMLAKGVNISHWFRWPPRNEPAALRSQFDDAAIAQLRRLGFTYVRLPIGPEE